MNHNAPENTPDADGEYTFDEEPLSRSEKKRRSTALQKMGEELAAMPLSALRSFGLPHDLLEAFEEYHQLSKHEAKRRQLQYVGKIMREVDIEPIQARLSEIHEGRAAAAADFHKLERLRDALVDEKPDAVDLLLEAYPQADVRHVRQLARNARKERDSGKPPKAFRSLFRYLRELEESQP